MVALEKIDDRGGTRPRCRTRQAELTGLGAWIACVADARPIDEYAALLIDAGLTATRGWETTMTGPLRAGWILAAITAAAAGTVGYLGLVTGRLSLDLGIGRRLRPLGPQVLAIAAPRDLVFDVIAQPYLGRATRAQREKIQVLERGDGMVLAAHRTPVGRGLVTQTVETVAFTRPDTVDFRLVRGPVPHVRERFSLTDDGGHTRLEYTGEMGTDGGALGARWAAVVGRRWETAVADSLATVKSEAERRHALRRTPSPGGRSATAAKDPTGDQRE